MRKFLLGFVLLIWVFVLAVDAQPIAAQAGDAWALIAEVNAYRAANGLPPFEVDGSLMAAAQGHSEYMAESGIISHGGPGGSSARDRAVAAGYGGGAAVQVIENIAGGNNLSPSQTVYSMWQDDLHRQTMLTSYYGHIGAGVANSGSFVYYTIDVGRIQGAPPPPTATLDPAATPAPANTLAPTNIPAPTKVVAQPVVVATPQADGTIMHVVQPGQALYTIAVVYEVALGEILALNGLTMDSVIYPGDEIVIQVGLTPTLTQSALPTTPVSASATATVTIDEGSDQTPAVTKTKNSSAVPSTARPTASTSEPRELAKAQPAESAVVEISDSAAPSAVAASEDGGLDIVFLSIFFFVLIGVAMVVFGGFLRRSSERESGSDPPQEP
jgi:LysM repeat protein